MTRADRFRLRAIAIPILVAAGVLAHLPAAHAQSAEAEALFRDGRKLIKAGKIADGCDKLAASAQLETSIGTLLNLGDCREKLGLTATAWAAFRKAEALAKRAGNDDKRMLEARRRAARLEPTLPNLTISVRDVVDGMVIKRGPDVVDRAVWNIAVPVDPGTYEIVAEAPGRVAWRFTVTIPAKTRRDVVVPGLAIDPGATPAVDTLPGPTGRVVVAPADVVIHHRTWSGTRKAAVALGVLGLAAGAGGGIYFGMRSRDLEDQADALCPTAQCDDPEALRLNDDARTAATRANIFLAAGGAAVVVASVMWFVGAPAGETVVAPAVSADQVGVSLAGSF